MLNESKVPLPKTIHLRVKTVNWKYIKNIVTDHKVPALIPSFQLEASYIILLKNTKQIWSC